MSKIFFFIANFKGIIGHKGEVIEPYSKQIQMQYPFLNSREEIRGKTEIPPGQKICVIIVVWLPSLSNIQVIAVHPIFVDNDIGILFYQNK